MLTLTSSFRAGVLGLNLIACASHAVAADDINFNRDIRPILSANCFACHGFDAKQRKADLRLDIADGAFAEHDGRTAVKPRDLNASELWKRVISADENEVMPPPSTKKTLTAEQKAKLKKWIEQGAPYQKHWAFEAPVAVTPPVIDSGRVQNEIDRFLLEKLQKEGLTTRPEASKETLIRRVAFALTGLPPTIAETNAFLQDTSAKAYENMVDRYLQSPRYGEEMARHWLDVARYADTHGLHLDNERSMWAYRDWVINAFNQNKPFDQFTVEQLAGDLLPNPTPEQLIATGFNRCNVTTSEGGSIESEWVYRYAVDRTSTMMQTWMGLTGGCAVCHDHKYDPISAKEFYSLYAFYYSAADPGMDRNTNTTDPFYSLATPQQKAAIDQLRTAETAAKKQFEDAARAAEYIDPATVTPAPASRPVVDVWLDDLFPEDSKVTCSSRNASVWSTRPDVQPPLGRRALKQFGAANYHDKIDTAQSSLVIPAQPTLSVWVRVDSFEPSKTLQLELATSRGNRRFLWGDINNYKGSNEKQRLGDIPTPGRWTQLTIPENQLELQTGDTVKMITLAQFGGVAWWDGLQIAGTVAPATDVRSSLTAWWKAAAGKDTPGVPGDLAAFLKAGPKAIPTEGDAANTEEAKQDRERLTKLRQYYLTHVARLDDGVLAAFQQVWQAAKSARVGLEESIPGTFIFKDLDKPREAFVMLRGQYDQPGEKVEPGVPAVFPPLAKSENLRANRLDLAKWLLSPDQPLTARVTVNRFWQQLFGTGLVKSSFDFGSQGDSPSHPELLDWLAVWYRDHGWDTKALVKLMVMSAAFRQDATLTSEVLQRDPENRWYARGPRFRLDAEQIRDNALYVSGLINLNMGGRGVKGYQPPGLWEPVGYSDSNTRFYLQDHGPALYRRSIYAFLKRTAPPPFMSNFDGPNREQFCTRRERSNTPLQALQLLNDTQHFEAARSFGARMLTEGGTTPAERITFGYRATLSRDPDADELQVVQTVLDQYLDRYRQDPAAAKAVVSVGESTPPGSMNDVELAAYTLIGNLILNLDETVTRN